MKAPEGRLSAVRRTSERTKTERPVRGLSMELCDTQLPGLQE